MRDAIRSELLKVMSPDDADFQIQSVAKLPVNEWFRPQNTILDNTNDICDEWALSGLMCKKIVPLWKNGSRVGSHYEYLFNPDLNYWTQPTSAVLHTPGAERKEMK